LELSELKKETSFFNQKSNSNSNNLKRLTTFESPLTSYNTRKEMTSILSSKVDSLSASNINNSKETNKNNTNTSNKSQQNNYLALIEDMRDAIKTLIIHKLVLPSSSTNKNILQKLDFVINNLNTIKKEEFFDVNIIN